MKDNIFELMDVSKGDKKSDRSVCLGIRVAVSGRETRCPVTEVCSSYDDFEKVIQTLKDNLEAIRVQAKDLYHASEVQGGLNLRSDMPVDEIWAVLSQVADDDSFVDGFNTLEEIKRREVAEHVLTQCNVFSGKPALFSSRYDNDSGLLK